MRLPFRQNEFDDYGEDIKVEEEDREEAVARTTRSGRAVAKATYYEDDQDDDDDDDDDDEVQPRRRKNAKDIDGVSARISFGMCIVLAMLIQIPLLSIVVPFAEALGRKGA
jgi:hypothetical protein